MGSHPLNLGLRFLLEIAALISIGYWGWGQGEGWPRLLATFGLPLLAAVLWGTFNVAGDPSRSGKAPVPVPGAVRLGLELAYFGFAAWGLYDRGAPGLGLALGVITVLHYALSYDRVAWLLRR